MSTHYGYWSQIEPPPREPRTAQKCDGCGLKMVPITRAKCRTCRPKAPRPGYVRPEVRRSAFAEIATVAATLTQMGFLSQGVG